MATLSLTNDFDTLLGTNEDFSLVQGNFTDITTWANAAHVAEGQLEDGAVTPTKLAVLPTARVFHSASQNLLDATTTILSFNSERFDTDTIHDTVTNNSRLTCQTTGIYQIFAGIQINPGSVELIRGQVALLLNGTTLIAVQETATENVLHSAILTVTTEYSLVATDFVEVRAFQDSGDTATVPSAAQWSPEFGMSFLTRAS